MVHGVDSGGLAQVVTAFIASTKLLYA